MVMAAFRARFQMAILKLATRTVIGLEDDVVHTSYKTGSSFPPYFVIRVCHSDYQFGQSQPKAASCCDEH
jgi:hypothetical protein